MSLTVCYKQLMRTHAVQSTSSRVLRISANKVSFYDNKHYREKQTLPTLSKWCWPSVSLIAQKCPVCSRCLADPKHLEYYQHVKGFTYFKDIHYINVKLQTDGRPLNTYRHICQRVALYVVSTTVGYEDFSLTGVTVGPPCCFFRRAVEVLTGLLECLPVWNPICQNHSVSLGYLPSVT